MLASNLSDFIPQFKLDDLLAIYNGDGQRVQLSDVAEVLETTGADTINHVDLERSLTLTASVASDAPLGALIDRTQQEILAPLQQELPPGVRVELAGSADVLAETLFQLGSTFLLSLVITYLLLVALYHSFIYPLLIMATVPMGMTGGLISLVIANSIPGMVVPLDMITGLGFVILTGVVVNNAILLVDRALQLQAEGMEYDASLYSAVGDRLRPIFMSAGTSGSSLSRYIRHADLIIVPFKPHVADLEVVVGWFLSLKESLQSKVLFVPNMISNTKEQRSGVAELESVIAEETRGQLLPGLMERKAVYPPILNGSKKNFFDTSIDYKTRDETKELLSTIVRLIDKYPQGIR